MGEENSPHTHSRRKSARFSPVGDIVSDLGDIQLFPDSPRVRVSKSMQSIQNQIGLIWRRTEQVNNDEPNYNKCAGKLVESS